MKKLKQLQTLISGLTLGAVVAVGSVTGVSAAPLTVPPTTSNISGAQSRPSIEPGTRDAKATNKLGTTKEIKIDAVGKPITAQLGNVSGVDFTTFSQYCYKDLVYTTVYNSTSAAKSIRVMVWNQGHYRDMYTSVAAGGSYTYPAFYGVVGAYTAYLYVWNGSSYVYDEYKSGTNTCSVSVSRVYNTGGWVQLKIQNTGTAYASQVSTELAPYPASGTYTGTHYDYPTAGGAAIYRWFNVGTQPYGIASYTSGSSNSPYFFTGDL